MDTRNQHGALSWGELTTPDPDAAAAFYGAVLGWTSEAMPMPGDCNEVPEGTTYTVFTNRDGTKVGGAMKPMPGMPADIPPHWGLYITVDDVDAAVAAAVANGGSVVVPPMDTPGVGRMAHLADPQGAHLAIIAYSEPL